MYPHAPQRVATAHNRARSSHRAAIIAAAAIVSLPPCLVRAVVATWDGNAAIGIPGDGVNWSDADNWTTNGVVDTAPPGTAPGDDLTFGNGTAGQINLQGNQFANSMAFNAGFTLDAPGSTDTLTIATGTVSVADSVSATINAAFAGSEGLTKTGNGTLNLSGSYLDSAGATLTVAGGLLAFSGAAVTGKGSTVIDSGAAMNVSGSLNLSGSVTNSGNITVGSNAALNLANAAGTFNQNSGTLSINGAMNSVSNFNYSGGSVTGTVTFGNDSSWSPTLTLGSGAGNSGTFTFMGMFGTLANGSSPVTIPAGVTITAQSAASSSTWLAIGTATNDGNFDLINNNLGVLIFGSLANSGVFTTSQNASVVHEPIQLITLNNSGTANINTFTYFTQNVINSGNFTISSGSELSFGGTTNKNSIQNSGTFSSSGILLAYTISNTGVFSQTGTLTAQGNFTNSGTVTLGGTQTWSANTTYTNSAGLTTFASDVGSATSSPLTLNITGGMVSLAAPQHLGGLTITGNGTLDLTNNHVIINYGQAADPYTAIMAAAIAGYNNGAENDAGIISSTAALAANSANYSVGYADGNDGIDPSISSGQIAVKYTLYGDCELQGSVTGADFTILAENFGKNVTGGWEDGDFLGTGSVTGQDFTLLAENFGQTAQGTTIALPASDWQALDAFADAHGLQSSVPEPASASLITLGAAALISRRKR